MPQHVITTADEITVSLGKDRTIVVGTQRLTNDVVTHIFMYGLRQILNDAHASEKESDAKVALATKRLEALYEGKLGRGPSAPRDPVAREAKRLAEAALNAFLASKGKKRADVADDKWAEALRTGIERCTPQARKNVAAAQRAGEGIEIDL